MTNTIDFISINQFLQEMSEIIDLPDLRWQLHTKTTKTTNYIHYNLWYKKERLFQFCICLKMQYYSVFVSNWEDLGYQNEAPIKRGTIHALYIDMSKFGKYKKNEILEKPLVDHPRSKYNLYDWIEVDVVKELRNLCSPNYTIFGLNLQGRDVVIIKTPEHLFTVDIMDIGIPQHANYKYALQKVKDMLSILHPASTYAHLSTKIGDLKIDEIETNMVRMVLEESK